MLTNERKLAAIPCLLMFALLPRSIGYNQYAADLLPLLAISFLGRNGSSWPSETPSNNQNNFLRTSLSDYPLSADSAAPSRGATACGTDRPVFEFAAEHDDKRDRGRDRDVRVWSELGSAQPCSDRERRADQDHGGFGDEDDLPKFRGNSPTTYVIS